MLFKISKMFKTLNRTRTYSQQANKDFILKYLKGEHVGIATFGLNRPEQKNAISMNLLEELLKAVDKVHYENKARVLIIHSLIPGAFCAGNLNVPARCVWMKDCEKI